VLRGTLRRPANRKNGDRVILLQTRLVILLLCITNTWCCSAFGTESITTLTVGGTGSGLGFMRLLGKSYTASHPEVRIEVLPSLGSGGGIRALKTGALDLAVASRALSERDKVAVNTYFLGKSPFVFAVHPATNISDVTLTYVASIYDGTISTWRDGSRIRRIIRPPYDSDWQLMHNLSARMAKSLDIAQEEEGLYLAVTDADAITYLERIRGSFGATTLTMVLAEERKVKVLSFHDIKPGVHGTDQEVYPLTKPYHLLTRNDAPLAVQQFVDFIYSAQGKEILERVGIMSGSNER
jgi:phosphate transport system substrate-binding protein